ncbi:MAG TPA: polyprenol monophosphomannose synthase [Candidatus Cloacimonadota bacterium]|nr:polyprenol monophosphomannose synthase [Candidatus Cloacimonadota bacterium]HPT71684.1 polyprenol monophosphomannose synthase [Candidatus Cloacimonadota bacterium]
MKALVIIPTYNEIRNAPRIVTEVLKQDSCIDVLIVDDNSPDGTGKAIRDMQVNQPRIHLLERTGKLGLGSAYVEGFKYGISNHYDYIFEMDADFSHDPAMLPVMLEAIRDADLVIGSRYVNGVNVVNWPIMRLFLSYGASKYVRTITRMPIKDPTGGFKCFRREVLESIDLNTILSDGYSFQIEMNYRTWLKKFRIKEISIIFYERSDGQSKMSKHIIWEAIYMVWWLRIKAMLHHF